MRYIITFLLFAVHALVHAEGTFDGSCFREYATLNTASGVTAVGVKNVDDDVFFVSGNNVLPARVDTTEKNPPIRYTSSDTKEIIKLQDVDPFTAIEVDPYLLSQGNVSYVFDLGSVYTSDTLVPNIGYYTHGKVEVSISTDGASYTPVNLYNLASFDFRYVKVTFLKQAVINDITRFHTLTFFQKIQTRYLVETPEGVINLYASYACQQGKYKDFLAARVDIGYIAQVPATTKSVTFSPNPSYRNDTDNDRIENLTDNCPTVTNTDQKDRNRDGIGDACSDDDSDGIVGGKDNCPTVANTDQKDLNANNIGDACEFDTDNDGIPDGNDNAIHVKNQDQKDTDIDGIGDVIDNCKLYNPDQLDLDKNTIGDVCDRQTEYEKVNDEDKDGILDFSDNCKKIPNPDQKDTDTDGIGDACDNCMSIKNPDQKDENKNAIGDMCEDIDNDSVEGWRDNCPTVANSDQADANNNSVGNACEDTDSDGIYDSTDNCPASYNPDQRDTDNDAIGNACDKEDNRILESNKTLFIVIFSLVSLLFIGIIFYFVRKLNL